MWQVQGFFTLTLSEGQVRSVQVPSKLTFGGKFFYFVYLIEDKGSPGAGDDGVEERRGHVSPFPPLGGRAIRRRWQEDFTFRSFNPSCHYNRGNMVMKIHNALGGQMGLFHNDEKVGESHKKR